MNVLGLQPRLQNSAGFSPRLQHAVRLLQMSTLDYEQSLQEAALANPFLDVGTSGYALDPMMALAQADSEPEFEWAQRLDRQIGGEPAKDSRLSHEDSLDLLQQMPVRMNLRSHLRAELGVLRLDQHERFLVELVVEALDEDGYLRTSLEELGAALGDNVADYEDELRTALLRVQALDPPGVAARSLVECLSLQLRSVADVGLRSLAQRIVSNYLELLAMRKLSRLALHLDVSEAETRRAVQCILKLNPRPGARYNDVVARTIVPDVIVRKVGRSWKTALNGQALPRVSLNHSYAALFEKNRAQGDLPMKACLDQARWTVQNAAQRMSTILDIASAIASRQIMFLEYGYLAMKPLGLREVADAVGVHPSTVSRAVRHKYMATPHGVFELHYFFSRGMAHTAGGASAPAALQALIREIIEAERPETPWSDAALARELSQQGFHIARRTVTKYRQGLNIAAVERRRET
jgi:RNA polymerase sigma-54 factor